MPSVKNSDTACSARRQSRSHGRIGRPNDSAGRQWPGFLPEMDARRDCRLCAGNSARSTTRWGQCLTSCARSSRRDPERRFRGPLPDRLALTSVGVYPRLPLRSRTEGGRTDWAADHAAQEHGETGPGDGSPAIALFDPALGLVLGLATRLGFSSASRFRLRVEFGQAGC
jgi:hypothetical protein